jgi:DNA-directed RNA polymerase subunit RPC12/RpoP
MKVCGICGEEFDGKDGENVCLPCEAKSLYKRQQARKARRQREAVLRSCGLTKVRGALGGTYWE